MIAIVKIGGHQAIIEAGEQIEVDKINKEVGETIQLETLLISSPDGSDTQIGAPVLETKVEAKIIEHGRGKKIRVYKMKQRKRYRRTKGHRQDYTIIEITKIGAKSASKKVTVQKTSTVNKSSKTKATPKKPTIKGDDLTKLEGVGKVYASKLNDEGIFTFEDVAKMTQKQIDIMEEKYTFKGDFKDTIKHAKTFV